MMARQAQQELAQLQLFMQRVFSEGAGRTVRELDGSTCRLGDCAHPLAFLSLCSLV